MTGETERRIGAIREGLRLLPPGVRPAIVLSPRTAFRLLEECGLAEISQLEAALGLPFRLFQEVPDGDFFIVDGEWLERSTV